MGNHTVDCAYCGEDTRGLSGARGCRNIDEATGCSNYRGYSRPRAQTEEKRMAVKASDLERAMDLHKRYKWCVNGLTMLDKNQVARMEIRLTSKFSDQGCVQVEIANHQATAWVEEERNRLAAELRKLGVEP